MDVSNSDEAFSLQHLRVVLTDWFKQRQPATVQFIESTKPQEDPDSRYTVVYEAVFEPSTLDRFRAEIWATTDGEIAVGLEKRNRIAKRLGVKNWQEGFAAGHEPYQVTQEGLLALLTLVANGEIAITATTFPISGLAKTKAVVHSNSYNILSSQGYDCHRWLKVADEFQPSDLRFKPW